MERFFNIRYEFDVPTIHNNIDQQVKLGESGYICVADGNILNMVNRNEEYKKIVDGSLFSICDSSWTPTFIKWIYGYQYKHYCGNDIFTSIVTSRKYRMAFLGAKQIVLNNLKLNLQKQDPAIADMLFYELPFHNVENFDYPSIAEMLNKDGADIIWIALGAPKQEIFMSKLKPYLKKGVIIAVGAVFNFNCGLKNVPQRSPEWLRKHHLEILASHIQGAKETNQALLGYSYNITKDIISRMENKKKKREIGLNTNLNKLGSSFYKSSFFSCLKESQDTPNKHKKSHN